MIDGVGPEAPVTVNESGGAQSSSPYRLDLIDPEALLALGKILKQGFDKYPPINGRQNWRHIPTEDHLNHALVHVYAFLAGDTQDDHLEHAFCRLMFAVATANDKPEPINFTLMNRPVDKDTLQLFFGEPIKSKEDACE